MPIRINLLAEAQAAEELRRKDPVKRAAWIGFFIVCLVLLWSSFLQARIITDNSRLVNLEGKLSSHTNQYTQILNNQKHLLEVNNHLVALARLATNRFLEASPLNALQHVTAVEGVQLIKYSTDQAFIETAEVRGSTGEGGAKIPGRPAATVEKIKLLLTAKDSSQNPGGEQIYKYQEYLSRTPYFIEQHIPTNEIVLKSVSLPQVDSQTGKPFVTFTLECNFPDRAH